MSARMVGGGRDVVGGRAVMDGTLLTGALVTCGSTDVGNTEGCVCQRVLREN